MRHGRQWETRPREGPGLHQGACLPSQGFLFPFNAAVKPRSCHFIFATFWNRFYGTCSILEQETDGKSSVVELETFQQSGVGSARSVVGAAVVCAWGWLKVSVSWVGLVMPGRFKVGLYMVFV